MLMFNLMRAMIVTYTNYVKDQRQRSVGSKDEWKWTDRWRWLYHIPC